MSFRRLLLANPVCLQVGCRYIWDNGSWPRLCYRSSLRGEERAIKPKGSLCGRRQCLWIFRHGSWNHVQVGWLHLSLYNVYTLISYRHLIPLLLCFSKRYNLPVVIIVVNNNGIYSGVDPETWKEMAKVGDLTSVWVAHHWDNVHNAITNSIYDIIHVIRFEVMKCHRVACQCPSCVPPTRGTLWRGHDRVRGSRVPGEDGGGAAQRFTAQPEWLGETESPKRAHWPFLRQKTAGNRHLSGMSKSRGCNV